MFCVILFFKFIFFIRVCIYNILKFFLIDVLWRMEVIWKLVMLYSLIRNKLCCICWVFGLYRLGNSGVRGIGYWVFVILDLWLLLEKRSLKWRKKWFFIMKWSLDWGEG